MTSGQQKLFCFLQAFRARVLLFLSFAKKDERQEERKQKGALLELSLPHSPMVKSHHPKPNRQPNSRLATPREFEARPNDSRAFAVRI